VAPTDFKILVLSLSLSRSGAAGRAPLPPLPDGNLVCCCDFVHSFRSYRRHGLVEIAQYEFVAESLIGKLRPMLVSFQTTTIPM
jgi:hypothetical protein